MQNLKIQLEKNQDEYCEILINGNQLENKQNKDTLSDNEQIIQNYYGEQDNSNKLQAGSFQQKKSTLLVDEESYYSSSEQAEDQEDNEDINLEDLQENGNLENQINQDSVGSMSFSKNSIKMDSNSYFELYDLQSNEPFTRQTIRIMGTGASAQVKQILDLKKKNRKFFAQKTFKKIQQYQEELQVYKQLINTIKNNEIKFKNNLQTLHQYAMLLKDKNEKKLSLYYNLGLCSLSEFCQQRAQENIKWGKNELLYIFKTLINFVLFFHKNNFYHSDLKPLNIVLQQPQSNNDSGNNKFYIKIIDFGEVSNDWHKVKGFTPLYFNSYKRLQKGNQTQKDFISQEQRLKTEIYTVLRTFQDIICLVENNPKLTQLFELELIQTKNKSPENSVNGESIDQSSSTTITRKYYQTYERLQKLMKIFKVKILKEFYDKDIYFKQFLDFLKYQIIPENYTIEELQNFINNSNIFPPETETHGIIDTHGLIGEIIQQKISQYKIIKESQEVCKRIPTSNQLNNSKNSQNSLLNSQNSFFKQFQQLKEQDPIEILFQLESYIEGIECSKFENLAHKKDLLEVVCNFLNYWDIEEPVIQSTLSLYQNTNFPNNSDSLGQNGQKQQNNNIQSNQSLNFSDNSDSNSNTNSNINNNATISNKNKKYQINNGIAGGSLNFLDDGQNSLNKNQQSQSLSPLKNQNQNQQNQNIKVKRIPFLFQKNQDNLFILLGDSGTGKSSFLLYLKDKLNHPEECILIKLNFFQNEDHFKYYIQQILDNYNEGQPQSQNSVQPIIKKKLKPPLIFLLDGYDELFRGNNDKDKIDILKYFDFQKYPDTKIILTCRKGIINQQNLKYLFKSQYNPQTGFQIGYSIYFIAQFSRQQIEYFTKLFIEKVSQQKHYYQIEFWEDEQKYLQQFQKNIILRQLAQNPLILRMIMEVLPKIERKIQTYIGLDTVNSKDSNTQTQQNTNQNSISINSLSEKDGSSALSQQYLDSNSQMFAQSQKLSNYKSFSYSKYNIYNEFLFLWVYRKIGPTQLLQTSNSVSNHQFQNNSIKNNAKIYQNYSVQSQPTINNANKHIQIKKVYQEFSHFNQSLAFIMYQNCQNSLRLEQIIKVYESHIQNFFDFNYQLILQYSPLRYVNSNFEFTHKSFYEFFLADLFIKNLINLNNLFKQEKDIIMLWNNFFQDLLNSPLNKRIMRSNEKQCIQIMTEYFIYKFDNVQILNFKETLIKIMKMSKNSIGGESINNIAANTAMIYNNLKFSFSGLDLSNINIQGAQLMESIFYNTNLQNANLKNTNFSQSNLSYSDFSGADMENVNFGKIPDLQGHKQWVTSACFSKSQKYVVSSSRDTIIKLWDVKTGLEIREYRGHQHWVTSVKITNDEKYIVSSSGDTTVIIWDLQTAEIIQQIPFSNCWVTNIRLSQGDEYIAGAGGECTIRIWLFKTGELIQCLKGHTNWVIDVAFSANMDYIVSGGWDNTVRIWDWLQGVELRCIYDHKQFICSVDFSPDDQFVVSASWDNSVCVFNTTTWKIQHRMIHSDWVATVSFSPDSQYLVTSSWDKSVKIWNVLSGECIYTYTGHSYLVTSAHFSQDMKYILSSSADQTIKIWHVNLFQDELSKIQDAHSKSVKYLNFSKNSDYIVSSSADKTVRIWNRITGKSLQTLVGHKEQVTCAVFSHDNHKIASSGVDKYIKIWDVQTGNILKNLKKHVSWVVSINFSSDDTLLVSGSWDKEIKIWDVITGVEIQTLNLHDSYISSVNFSPDDQSIISTSFDKTIKITSVKFPSIVKTLRGHTGAVRCAAFSKDNFYIVSGGSDAMIILWNFYGTKVKRFLGHSDSILSVSFTPCNKYILSSSLDKYIRLWDIKVGDCIQKLKHETWITCSTISQCGQYICSSSDDKKIKIWKYKKDFVRSEPPLKEQKKLGIGRNIYYENKQEYYKQQIKQQFIILDKIICCYQSFKCDYALFQDAKLGITNKRLIDQKQKQKQQQQQQQLMQQQMFF